MDSNIVKFPYTVSRRAHSRKPRSSKNGAPEERAAMAAQEITVPPDLWAEAKLALHRLNVKKRMPEAVKCLHLLLAKNVSASALLVRQRGASKSDVISAK
jgi:hypothetical protein